jgi:anti-sigma regulatory factor (Ser/Thr protein kinase)
MRNELTDVIADTIDAGQAVVVVSLHGTLTLRGCAEVRRTLTKCLADSPAAVVVDISDLLTPSRTHLAVFHAAAQRNNAVVALACPTAEAMAAAGSHLLGPVNVYESVEQAYAQVITAAARQRFQWRLPPLPESVRSARRLVTDACRQWGFGDLIEPADVVISELVGNVVRHARTPMVVTLTVRGQHLFLTVRDERPDGDLPPRGTPLPDPASMAGRGLFLVDLHSCSRGLIRMADGKCVWAALRTEPVHATRP